LYKVEKHQGKTTTRQETLDGKTWEVAAGEGNYIHTPFGRLHLLFAMCAGLWRWFRAGKLQQLQSKLTNSKMMLLKNTCQTHIPIVAAAATMEEKP
jgi:hypothetical protein